MNGLSLIADNVVCCVRFRDPQYPKGFIFPAVKLKGAKTPLRVLKPQDLDPQANRNWRPIIGMAPSNVRYFQIKLTLLLLFFVTKLIFVVFVCRASIGQAGHRMLDHHAPKVPGAYSNVPPPNYGNSYSRGR